MSPTTDDPLGAAAPLLAALDREFSTVVAGVAQACSRDGQLRADLLDARQLVCYELALAKADLLAADATLRAAPGLDALDARLGALCIADAVSSVLARLTAIAIELGLALDGLDALACDAAQRAFQRDAASGPVLARIGAAVAAPGSEPGRVAMDESLAITQESFRRFAAEVVAPLAEEIHRRDLTVPETLLGPLREMGVFGLSIPERHGGSRPDDRDDTPLMLVVTEALSEASLAAAGSLITRPEILTKALLKGGTAEQKAKWLPPIAAGEVMVGVSVTEPDTGSDVASLSCRAEPAERDGAKGWVVNGAKAWCTFAGRANVLALLARTDPNPNRGAKGLSLFIVPKDTFPGHAFEMRQPNGGALTGKADATPGYRGMHSFTLMFDNYFVPGENLIGGEGGVNKGFYLQMAGFAAGRLQTGGRATGLAQAALQRTAEYANDRKQFGKPIGQYGLTQYKLGRMATHIAAGRQLTYAAARAMDADETIALEPAMAKLFASDVAVWVTQEGQQLHGGWGYAEEFPISRYVVDATVLPIFEGVKPILELKVIARNLLG